MKRPDGKIIDLQAVFHEKAKQEEATENLRYRVQRLRDIEGLIISYEGKVKKFSTELKGALTFRAEPDVVLPILVNKLINELNLGLRQREKEGLEKLDLSDSHFDRKARDLNRQLFKKSEAFKTHFLNEAENIGIDRDYADHFLFQHLRPRGIE